MTPNYNKLPAALMLLGLVLATAVGCDDNAAYLTPERMDEGMVVILPGVEGVSGLNKAIRLGLDEAGITCAMPIRSWGRLGALFTQVDFLGNRLAANRLARNVEKYQDDYPGRPVYIVGHSGGGGIAVLVAAALGEGRQVDGVIVLSGSISSAYDLEKALGHTRYGIVNFYNRNDGALLAVFTTLLGNVDGIHGPSAGLLGFDEPKDDDDDEKKQAYTKLYQIEVTNDMILGGGSHTAVTDQNFVSWQVAPWVYSSVWPATYAHNYAFVPAPPEELEEPQESDEPDEPDETALSDEPQQSDQPEETALPEEPQGPDEPEEQQES